jgi:hypothetical protein
VEPAEGQKVMDDDTPPSFADLQARGVIPTDNAPAPQAATEAAPAAAPQAAPSAGPGPSTQALKTIQTAQRGDSYRSGDGRIYKMIASPYDPSGQANIGVLQTGDGAVAQHPKAERLHIIADPVTITASKAPQTAVSAQPSATGADIVVDVPRGVRNNNHGNIKPSPGQTFPGQTGVDAQGFAQFQTPQDGAAAADTILQTYGAKHGINTVQGVVSRWAPDAPPEYAPAVAAHLGVKPTDPIDLSDPQVRQQVAQGITVQEGNGGAAAPAAPAPGPPEDDTPPSFADLQARGVIPPSPAAAPAAPGLPQRRPVTDVGSFLSAQNQQLGDILNTATFGGEHRLNAALSALTQLPAAIQQGSTAPLGREFSRSMDYQQALQPTGAAHAINTAAGGVVQALAMPEIKAGQVLGQGLTTAAEALPVVGKYAPMAGRALVGAGQGALLGALQGVGEARGNLQQMFKQGYQGGKWGALIGAPLGAMLGAPAKAIPQAEASMADFARTKIDPMLALMGGAGTRRMGRALSKVPVVGAPITRAAHALGGQMDAAAQRVAASMGRSQTPHDAGEALQAGGQAAIDAMNRTKAALYAIPNKLEASTQRFPVRRSQQAVRDLFANITDPAVRARVASKAPQLASMGKTLASAGGLAKFGIGRVRYAELKELRREIGGMLKDPEIMRGLDEARVKAVYAAMKEDLHAGAEEIGGKGARAALVKADAFNTMMRQRSKDTLDAIMKFGTSPEQAFKNVKNMVGSKAGANLDKLQRLVDLLPEQARREFSSAMINDLGRDAEGGFNPAKFAREWGDMSPEAKRTIIGDDKAVGDLDALFRIAKRQSDIAALAKGGHAGHGVGFGLSAIATEKLTELLHEHGLTGLPQLAAGHVPETLAALGSLVGGRTAAKLLSSPGFARLMLGAQRGTPEAEAATLASMRAYAKANPSVRQEVLNYTAELAKRFNANAPITTSTAIAQDMRQRVAQGRR